MKNIFVIGNQKFSMQFFVSLQFAKKTSSLQGSIIIPDFFLQIIVLMNFKGQINARDPTASKDPHYPLLCFMEHYPFQTVKRGWFSTIRKPPGGVLPLLFSVHCQYHQLVIRGKAFSSQPSYSLLHHFHNISFFLLKIQYVFHPFLWPRRW